MEQEREPALGELMHAAAEAIGDLLAFIEHYGPAERVPAAKRYDFLELRQRLRMASRAEALALAQRHELLRIAETIRREFGAE